METPAMISPYLRREPRSLFQAIRDLRDSGCIDLETARELLLGVDRPSTSTARAAW